MATRRLVVVATRREAGTGHQGPEPCAVTLGENEAAGASTSHEGETAGGNSEWPVAEARQKEEGPNPDPSEVDEEVDVKAQVEAALVRIMAAAGPPPAMEAMEEDDQRLECSKVREAMEEDDGLEIVGAKEAHEVEQQEAGVADKAGPKTGEVETCRHWAKGWCMRADACILVHPQPPVPQGVPQDLPWILHTIARVGALSLRRAHHHETLMREVVERAQGGGLPAVGWAFACGSRCL